MHDFLINELGRAVPYGVNDLAAKANQGAAGVDGQSVSDFEADLSNNLYKLWNRMSSGSYFPPPVRRVDIPKDDGRTRPLGIPTVGDRIAQEVVKRYLEPRLEPIFHADSYGYRPGRSAIDALRKARQRCWRFDWVLDIGACDHHLAIDRDPPLVFDCRDKPDGIRVTRVGGDGKAEFRRADRRQLVPIGPGVF